MGNPNLIFIFNDNVVIKINGAELGYEGTLLDRRAKGYQLAIEKYVNQAKEAIAHWHKIKEENPEMVEENYQPENDYEIVSVKVYETID